MLAHAAACSPLPGLGIKRRGGRDRSRLFQRQRRKTFGLFQRGRELRLLGLLRHLQLGARLTGGLLGGNKGGTDLHAVKLTKQG